MGSLSIGHWIVVLAVVILVFGAGKIPVALGDIARGLKIFRREMADGGPAATGPAEAGATADARGAAQPGEDAR